MVRVTALNRHNRAGVTRIEEATTMCRRVLGAAALEHGEGLE